MDRYADERRRMVDEQIARRGIRDPRLLQALRTIPRHLFVPIPSRSASYEDGPLAIGFGQTISQPYIVALMTELLELRGSERVLEVGTGSGYQTAVLALMGAEIHSIELIPALAARAARILAAIGRANVRLHVGDGSVGWPEASPYQAIIVTAAAPGVPPPLVSQLAEGGRLVIPIETGLGHQMLTRLRCCDGEVTQEPIAGVAFVPLRGKHGWQR